MPLTMRQHESSLRQPAFCELLPIRDYIDNVIVRSNGALWPATISTASTPTTIRTKRETKRSVPLRRSFGR